MAILMSPRKFKRLGNAFSIGTTPEPKTVVISFVNYDGTVLQSSEVTIGEMPVYSGETPVREQTEQFIYTFTGWDSEIVEATEDKTYTAEYSEEIRTYTVRYLNGVDVLDTEDVPYGEYPLKSIQVLDNLNKMMIVDYNNEDYAYTFTQKVVPVTGDTDYKAILDDDPDVEILFEGTNGQVKHFLKRGYIRVRSNLGSIRIADCDVGGGEGVLGTQMYFGSTEKNNKETDNWILNWGRYDTKFHVPDIEEWYAFIKIVESIGITVGQGELLQMFNMYYVRDEISKQQGAPFYQWGGVANGYWSRTPVGAGNSSNPNDLLVGYIEPELHNDGLYDTYFRNVVFGAGATFCLRLFYTMPFEDTDSIFPYVPSSHDQTATYYPIMQIADIDFLKAIVSYEFSLQQLGELSSLGLFYREVISLSNSDIFVGSYGQIISNRINMSREYLDNPQYQDINGLYITAGVPTAYDSSGSANGWIIAKLYPSEDSSSVVKLYDRGVQASWANQCSGKISLTIDFVRRAFILSGYIDTNPGRGSPFHDEFETVISFNEIIAKWSNFYYLLFKRYIIMPRPEFSRSPSGGTVSINYALGDQQY